MAHLLHLDASPRSERLHSRKLSRTFVDSWLASHAGDTVTYRDLGHNPVPLVDEAMIAAVYAPAEARTEEARALLSIGDKLIDELFAADVYVFGIPMYNFGVPAGFKAYIDQVVRAGRTFAMPGYQGLLTGKRMFVAMSAGSDYAVGAPFANYDFVLPYLRAVFGFLGVTDLTTIAVATNSEEMLAKTEPKAHELIAQIVQSAA